MEQKKVLALHDLSAVGRAGLTQAMSALIAMGHQCIPLPTAVYSSHAGIPGPDRLAFGCTRTVRGAGTAL